MWPKGKFRPNFHISLCEILTNKQHRVKVQAESFHLNGHIAGFRPNTQKLESPYRPPSNTLAVKGIKYTIYDWPECMKLTKGSNTQEHKRRKKKS